MSGDHTRYAGAVKRMIQAHGRRVADSDPEDLAELVELREVLEATIQAAVDGQRRRFSWAEVARGLGTTRQAAQMRYGAAAVKDVTYSPVRVDPTSNIG